MELKQIISGEYSAGVSLPKFEERSVVIGGLFLFAFWLYVVLPFLYTVPRYNHQTVANHCSAEESKDHGFWEKTTCDPTAYFTLWLVAFTGVLAFSTIGLWVVTGQGVRTQAADTRILQRAYVSVEPRGLRLRVDGGTIMGHIAIRNAGNLPARNLNWYINIKWSSDGREEDFQLSEGKGSVVITPHSEAIRGSGSYLLLTDLLDACDASLARQDQSPVYIYVWGSIAYHDGFQDGRITKFCHRYNWMMRDNYAVDASHARLHEFGNDST